MSISCPACGAVAGYGQELAHKTSCPASNQHNVRSVAADAQKRWKIAYEVFRKGCKEHPPVWDELEPWMRDAIYVAWLQGTLDSNSWR